MKKNINFMKNMVFMPNAGTMLILLQTLQYFTLSYTSPFLVDTMTIRASSALINVITPGEKTVVEGGAIIGKATVVVMRGCEGIEVMLLLIAAGWARRKRETA